MLHESGTDPLLVVLVCHLPHLEDTHLPLTKYRSVLLSDNLMCVIIVHKHYESGRKHEMSTRDGVRTEER